MTCCRKTIRDPNGQALEVDLADSQPLIVTIRDKLDSSIVDPATLTTLELTLLDEAGNVVNGVSGQDIKDVDRGHINPDDTVTVTLREDDTTVQGVNVVQIVATWTDSTTNEPQRQLTQCQYEVCPVLAAV